MANGVFMQWLDEQAQFRKCELVVRAAGLDGSHRQILLEDFDRAVAVIYYELNLKLAFWQTLPYVLFGIGAGDLDQAKAAATRAIELYDANPDGEHHYLTTLMCSPDSNVAVQMRQFANGEAELDDLPELAEERLALQCASITEESIEGKHAEVNRGIRTGSCFSAAYVSAVVLRGPEIERRLEARAGFLKAMSMVLVARWAVSMAAALGLLGHPVLQRDLQEHKQRRPDACETQVLSHRVLGEVVYRCDLHTQFGTHSSAEKLVDGRRKFIEKKSKEHVKAILGNVDAVEEMRFLMASDHIQMQIDPMKFFTYNGRDGMTTLSSRFGADVDGPASGMGVQREEGMMFTDGAGSPCLNVVVISVEVSWMFYRTQLFQRPSSTDCGCARWKSRTASN